MNNSNRKDAELCQCSGRTAQEHSSMTDCGTTVNSPSRIASTCR